MKKINKLTADQEAQLAVYRERWTGIGLSTERVTLQRAIEIIHPLQEQVLGRKKTPVVILDNPVHAWMAVCALAQVGDQVRGRVQAQIQARVEAQVEAQVRSQIWAQVEAQVEAQVRDQVWVQVGVQVGAQVRAQIWNQIRDQFEAQVEDQGLDQVRDFVAPYLCGSFDSYIFAFYRFFEALGVNFTETLWEKFTLWEATTELGFIWPLEHICVVCQKPSAIRKNEHGLHCDSGAAVEYGDWKLHALNGVRVPEYLAVTPSGKLDMEFFHKEKNADVRTEFVRKYGVERMLSLGTKVDSFDNYDEEWWTKSEYELWDMAALFPNLDYQPYLKMLNQTTGVWHFEAVSPNCRTLRDAIKERFGGRDFSIKAIA